MPSDALSAEPPAESLGLGQSSLAEHDPPQPATARVGGRPVQLLEKAQDAITVTAGVLLVLLAVGLLVSGVGEFISNAMKSTSPGSITGDANKLLDDVLFVLILAEIVHTVVLSLRAHRLIAQPFLIVGLVAVIRHILLLLGSSAHVSVAVYSLLIGMVVVFTAGLIAVNAADSRFGNGKS
jgi:uncharacterized membrane protein (DUF373 family)